MFRDVFLRDWRAKTTELRLQQLASRFALPDDASVVDYELLVRHLAAALATAKCKAKRGRRTRFAPEPTRAQAAKRGQPLDGEEPWFARPAAPSYGRRRSNNDEDRDKTYFELSLSPARNRRASPRKARPRKDESDDDEEALYAPPKQNRAPDALSNAVADRRIGLNSAGSPPTFCAPAPDDHLFAGAPVDAKPPRRSLDLSSKKTWACAVCYYAGNGEKIWSRGICYAANPASAKGRAELLGLENAAAGRVVRGASTTTTSGAIGVAAAESRRRRGGGGSPRESRARAGVARTSATWRSLTRDGSERAQGDGREVRDDVFAREGPQPLSRPPALA